MSKKDKQVSKKGSTSKASEKKDNSKNSKKEESKKEESKKEESKKDESKKEESKKEESKKDESKKEDSKKEESKKDESKKEDGKDGKADSTKDEKKDKDGKSEAPKDDKKEEGAKSETAKSTSNATPEQIKKNQEMLEKVYKLMETLKPNQVTRGSKDDLRVVQQLIKNITFRDYGEKSRVREVELNDKQKEVIKVVSGSACNSVVDVVNVTMTEGEEGKSVSGDKINFPFEKLEFVKTKS